MSEEVKNEEVVEAVSDETAEVVEEGNGLAKGDTPDFKWFVTHVLSGYEGRVQKTLKQNILNHDLVDYFSEILVPQEDVTAVSYTHLRAHETDSYLVCRGTLGTTRGWLF